MLNAYPDSIGHRLADIVEMLQRPEFKDAFSLFYILPTFFHSDLDRGFSVIDYDINEAPRYRIASGERIASLPAPTLAEYREWETPLYAGPLEESDLSDHELAQTRARARELVRPQALLGGERLQLHLPNASSAVRARRAEGVLLGGGGAYRLDERSELSFWGGYPFGQEKPQLRLGADRLPGQLLHPSHRRNDARQRDDSAGGRQPDRRPWPPPPRGGLRQHDR